MSTTAFSLVFVPACVGVWLGIVMGFAIHSMIRGIDRRLPGPGPRPVPTPRATSSAAPAQVGRGDFDLLGASPRPSLWPRPWS